MTNSNCHPEKNEVYSCKNVSLRNKSFLYYKKNNSIIIISISIIHIDNIFTICMNQLLTTISSYKRTDQNSIYDCITQCNKIQ